MFIEGEKSMFVNENTGHDNSHHEDMTAVLDSEWVKSQSNKVIEGLRTEERLEDILQKIPGFAEAFQNKMDCLDCSDGRVCSGHKMGLAGVGILLSPEEKQILIKAVKDRGLRVTGHDSCGAAGMAFPGPDSDSHGYDNARALAEATGSEYSEVHKKDFVSPVHNERTLVVDATGRFDCANWKEFPAQFISSAPALGLPDSYIKKEIAALSGIALGDHGLGERFDAANPFYVIVSADNKETLNHLMGVALDSLGDFGDRVKVDGFIAPAPVEKE